MVHALYNPTFKAPSGFFPPRARSPTPPRDFVEPLSPTKPTPLEPSFNYPAINNHVNFTVRPEGAFMATSSRARAYSANQKSTHQRRLSTIDTLAEAALATTPSLQPFSPYHTTAFRQHEHVVPRDYASGDEPPHKRARSELLPSTLVTQYASRPATSYQSANGWSSSVARPAPVHDSRVEEAALLLNFQSGGSPREPTSPNLAFPGQRPHANSFPQDVYRPRPVETVMQPQPPLLPPFDPLDARQLPPMLPSPQKTIDDNGSSPRYSAYKPSSTGDIVMPDVDGYSDLSSQPVMQTHTPPEDASTDIALSETSQPPKRRGRGWPKGKPRGSGARKTMVEKLVAKRTATRKKGLAKGKGDDVNNERSDTPQPRRKSFSDTGQSGLSIDGPFTQIRARSVPAETPMLIHEVNNSRPMRRKNAVKVDIICAGCETTRATSSHGELDEWISCNGCKNWFHIDCAGFKKAHEVRDVDKYFCATCEPEHGKTTFVRKSARAHTSVDYAELQRGVLKTSEESAEHHYIQPIKDGTFVFDEETFPRMRPEMVTKEFFERSSTFVEPICIPAEWNPRPWEKRRAETSGPGVDGTASASDDILAELNAEEFEYDAIPDLGQDGLDMIMPEGLTVRQVCGLVGPETPIDVIDVKTQNTGAKWNLSRWADYYDEVGEEKAIRNVISLEVSQTKLGRLLQRPKLVRDIDLQDDVWPQEEIDKGKFPKVQFYCLMSVADSYTDFHIDFGGSSVYYHILKGKKTFFFIPPKAKHLKAYEEWNDSPQQNFTFLPSITNECYRVDLSEGDTMLIPSGWIHAVWTPEDSLVIGGNFLNRMSYKNQFKVVEIEKANETPLKFRYPHFQKIMWYTAIKYLREDPLPEAVSQLFYEGKRFEREVPVWADFDGEIANNDMRPGADNARFYSQAEVEGLPDLVNFIFRTVMLVMGRVEGISADRMKRVNISIPKGHGEPLELAKTFALWVAWKRGNEDPPAWAHPDAVLPSSKEEGPPKKLSERKLKELERKEAIAAWRVAPDRQSARVMTKMAKKDAEVDADGMQGVVKHESSSPASAAHVNRQPPLAQYQNVAYAMPQQLDQMVPGLPGHHLSTPKTSVLGPKRVACDACRKRRIRCKHKDQVQQTTPSQSSPPTGGSVAFRAQLASELHEDIVVTPSKPVHVQPSNVMREMPDGHANAAEYSYGFGDSQQTAGNLQTNAPQPGTNAYISANIPMTMNGVPIFGEVPKRGRSKACVECRKSKRRCIHDESGNVDPVKAAETPVPRGTVSVKKTDVPPEEGGSMLLAQASEDTLTHSPVTNAQFLPGRGVLKPQSLAYKQAKPSKAAKSARKSHPAAGGRLSATFEQSAHQEEQSEPPIDPSLFSTASNPHSGAAYATAHYPYHVEEPSTNYNEQQSYEIPSLEQIANEVLVDLNGNEHSEQNPARQPGAHSKEDRKADSAISIEKTDLPNGQDPSGMEVDVEPSLATALATSGLPTTGDVAEDAVARPSVEFHHSTAPQAAAAVSTTHETLPPQPQSAAKADLPLYQPPASLSQSPEMGKTQPTLPNGVTHPAQDSSPPALTASTSLKRKRDSTSATPGAKGGSANGSKRMKTEEITDTAGLSEEEKRSVELAKMLQQEDLGLRRRSK